MAEPCRVCGGPAPAQCSQCHGVWYCGPRCQRSDWKCHKVQCSAPASSSADSFRQTCVQKEDRCPRPGLSDGSVNGTLGEPAGFDVTLSGHRSLENAQRCVDILKKRGVVVVRAGAERSFQKALAVEAKLLWESGDFSEAQKGRPEMPGSEKIRFDTRDDKVLWLTSAWTKENMKRCKAVQTLDGQLTSFGFGLAKLLEEQLGLTLAKRTCGMLACYDGTANNGPRYDCHVDNPYQTSMRVPDDKRRLTVLYYINDGPWDVHKDGGALKLYLAGPQSAPKTAAEAVQAEKLIVTPESDTLVAFFSHTMYHAVLPVLSNRRRFALSTWFQCP